MENRTPQSLPNLRSAGLAVVIVAVLLAAGILWARRMEYRYVHSLAPKSFNIKNQAEALQATAFTQPDLLPIYGSSELVKAVPDSAARFFRLYPTGFNVFPVGKAGTSPLIMLQKLASVGDGLRGKKVAISISPTWFFNHAIKPGYYAGNFSTLQAHELIFSTNLSFQLKHDVARRMRAFPQTLNKSPLLAEAVARLARNSWRDRFFYRTLWPLGRMQIAFLQLEDHLETVRFIIREHALSGLAAFTRREPRELDWALLTEQASHDASAEKDLRANRKGGDRGFLTTMNHAQEWRNLDLLLRGLEEMGAQTLLLTMPVNGTYFDKIGVSAQARDQYYTRLLDIANRHQVAVVDFHEYEDDPKFLVDTKDHLSVEGWMHYNEALDAFFHDRMAAR